MHRASRKLSVSSMLSGLRAVLVDLSGTIHIDDAEIPGSIQALHRLATTRPELQVKFVTNTTKESKRALQARLSTIGFDIPPGRIFTSLTAARQVIDSRGLAPLLLVDDRALEDFAGVREAPHDSVVIGLVPDKFNYEHMNTAFRLVMDGAPIIAIHKGRYYKRKDGIALGPGPFVSALEYATDARAEVVGKPETSFFLAAIADLGVKPGECVMIGDDARDDVAGAVAAGMHGVLVKTGKYRDGDEQYLPSGAVAVDSFSDAVDTILEQLPATDDKT